MSETENVKKINVPQIQLTAMKFGMDMSKVDRRYLWFPGPLNVWLGSGIKSSRLHATWIGLVVMPVLFPYMVWMFLINPVIMAVYNGVRALLMHVVAVTLATIRGEIAGVDFDYQSLLNEAERADRRRMIALADQMEIPPQFLQATDQS